MTRDVVVLGAGVAGLACAVRLVQRGCRVTLLEARRSPGGRASSTRDETSGAVMDNGQHLFLSCYRDTLELLETLGTASLLRFQPRLAVDYLEPGGGRRRLRLPRLPAPWDLTAGVLRLGGLSAADRLAFLRAGGALRRLDAAGAAALESTSVAAWLDRLGQTPALRRLLWDPLTIATLNESPGNAPASLLARVMLEGFLAGGKAATLGHATVGLSALYAEPAVAWLRERGAEVRLGEPATRLQVRDRRVVAVERRGGEPIPCGTVVSALPPEALRRLEAPIAGLERFESSPILSINLWLDRPISQVADFDFAGLPEGRVQWLFNRERIVTGGGSYLAAVISAARDWVGRPNDELAAIAWDDVCTHLPAARAARLVRSLVVRERSATFASTVAAEPLRPGPGSPYENLILAGDWTMRGMPATIESAARSGHIAAALALS